MSDRNFNRRRRGGQRFRPPGGMNQPKHDKASQDARATAVGEKTGEEHVFSAERHEKEIQRAENVAAGLPPEGATPVAGAGVEPGKDREFRELRSDVEQPAQAEEAGGGSGSSAEGDIEPPREPGLVGGIRHVT